jgi:subtilisin family serine protease
MRVLLVAVLFSVSAFGQTTSTLCQSTPITAVAGIPEQRLLGCGLGFPDNLLWHLDRSDNADGTLDQKAHKRLSGRGAVVYLLDSAVLQTHQEFQRSTGSNVIAGFDATRGMAGNCSPLAPCKITGDFDYVVEGHGTATASVVGGRYTGVAPDAKIVAVYTVSSDDAVWERALQHVIAHAYDPASPQFQTGIVSMSFAPGYTAAPRFEALMRRMIAGVNAAGEADPNGKKFLFVVFGGNSGPLAGNQRGNCTPSNGVALFPATLAPQIDGLIAAGGLTKENTEWDGACRGPQIEVLAPATNILVASPTGTDHYRARADLVSGTSYSAPYVAGMAARLLESNPSYTPAQLEALLKQSPSQVAGKPVPVMIVEPWQRRRAVR